jgi:hypothetical protein
MLIFYIYVKQNSMPLSEALHSNMANLLNLDKWPWLIEQIKTIMLAHNLIKTRSSIRSSIDPVSFKVWQNAIRGHVLVTSDLIIAFPFSQSARVPDSLQNRFGYVRQSSCVFWTYGKRHARRIVFTMRLTKKMKLSCISSSNQRSWQQMVLECL